MRIIGVGCGHSYLMSYPMRIFTTGSFHLRCWTLRARSPVELGKLREHFPRAFAPRLAECVEIRVVTLETPPAPHLEAVALIAQEVDGHADADVASHRGVERHQHALG